MDMAYVAQSCALRCQFVLCNMHMQSWQAVSLNASLPMCACLCKWLAQLTAEPPASLSYHMPSSCTLWRQSGLRRKVSSNACHILGPIVLELFVTLSPHNARHACAAKGVRLCDACHRGSDQVLETPRSRNQVFEDVQLGPLLGQGGYGKVYRGLWNKTPVAVKVWGVFSNAQCSVTKT